MMRSIPDLRTAVSVAALICCGSGAAAKTCIFDLDPPPPYYVLGSLVVPQSSYLVSGDCSKTVEEVRAEFAAAEAERQAAAEAKAEAAANPTPGPTTDNQALDVWTAVREARAEAHASSSEGGCRVTLRNYGRLQTGMSYRATVAVLGCPGVEVQSTDPDGSRHVIAYQWTGNAGWGARMNAMFEDDRLVSKAQSGLK